MSKKFGTDRLDKWDKNLSDWENSEYYYSPEEESEKEEEEENESRERKRTRC